MRRAEIKDARLSAVLANHGYALKRQVGQGASGSAVLVERQSDKAKFVCKVVDLSVAFASETVAAKKETNLLADLKHPYVIAHQESFLEDGFLCIITDYCEGGDLALHIEQAQKQKSRFSEQKVLLWLSQALLALTYIHENHILHRDLKPGNLFITKEGNLKLGDFGISKVLSSTQAHAKTQIGTPYYLSPEVCQEQPYSWGSDVWALGCVLYELCALRVPFNAVKLSGLVQKICHEPTPLLPATYSLELRQLGSDMLTRDPHRRPSAAELLRRPVIQAQLASFPDNVQINQHVRGPSKEPMEAKLPKQRVEPTQHESLQRLSGIVSEEQRDQTNLDAPYRDSAGSYQKGDRIEYRSESHNEWLPGFVIASYPDGQIIIDLKPRKMISREIQAVRVRRREASKVSQGAAVPPFLLAPAWAREPYKPSWQIVTPRVGRVADPNRQLREASDMPSSSNVGQDVSPRGFRIRPGGAEERSPRGFGIRPGGAEERNAPLVPASHRSNGSSLLQQVARPDIMQQLGQYPLQRPRGLASYNVKQSNVRALQLVNPQRQISSLRNAGASIIQ